MSATDFQFSGDLELELMGLARNYNARLLHWVSKGLQPGERLLDFGAGTGRYCNVLKERGVDVAAVELDERYHAAVKCEVGKHVSNVRGPFDLIYSINVMEHIEDDHAVMKELAGALKQGGRVKVFVPALPMLFTKMDERVGHFRRYTKTSLTGLMECAGLQVTTCKYFDMIGVAATLAYKPIGNGSFSARSLVIYDRFVFPMSRVLDRMTGGKVIGKNLLIEAVRR